MKKPNRKEIARRLLVIARRMEEWYVSLPNGGKGIPDTPDGDVLTLALDILGEPKDEWTTEGQDKWCRDHAYHAFFEMVWMKNDIEGFINYITNPPVDDNRSNKHTTQ